MVLHQLEALVPIPPNAQLATINGSQWDVLPRAENRRATFLPFSQHGSKLGQPQPAEVRASGLQAMHEQQSRYSLQDRMVDLRYPLRHMQCRAIAGCCNPTCQRLQLLLQEPAEVSRAPHHPQLQSVA